MSSVIEKAFDLEFAGILLRESAKRLNLHLVPLRWLRKNSLEHWAKGHLISIQGQSLEVRPLQSTSHKRTELIDPNSAKLWTSKMSESQLRLAQALLAEIPPTLKHKSESPKEIMTTAITTLETSILSEQIIPPPVNPLNFVKQLSTFISLKSDLKASLQTDGIAHLRRQKKEYEDALAMAQMVKDEMLTLMALLREADIEIPSDLVIEKQSSSKPLSQCISGHGNGNGNIVQLQQVIPTKARGLTGLAREHEGRILAILREHPHELLTGRQIITALGINIKTASPAALLRSLVVKGVISQFGIKAGTRYKATERVEIISQR